jgi:cysteinyl-tRNA synthetase
MSKSLGNFFTIREILDKFDAEVIRLFLLSTHYRSPIEFSDEQLRETEISLDRYYSTVLRINDFSGKGDAKRASLNAEKNFEERGGHFREKFEEAMDDDFNTALAIGHIFEFIRDINKFLDSKPSGQKAGELFQKAKELLSEVGRVLNIFGRTPEEWYLALMTTKKIYLSEKEILEKIEQRQEARLRKEWDAADRIRKELDEKGIILEDKAGRTDWKVKAG